MLGKGVAISSFVALSILLIVVQSTTPSSIGPIGLLAVFFLLYVVLLGVFTVFLYVGSRVIVRFSRMLTSRRPLRILPLKKIYYYSSVLALAPVMILAMKSIGSLGLYEIVLVGIFITVAILYVGKREF